MSSFRVAWLFQVCLKNVSERGYKKSTRPRVPRPENQRLIRVLYSPHRRRRSDRDYDTSDVLGRGFGCKKWRFLDSHPKKPSLLGHCRSNLRESRSAEGSHIREHPHRGTVAIFKIHSPPKYPFRRIARCKQLYEDMESMVLKSAARSMKAMVKVS